jgi:Uma2 family endonuclease
MTTSSALVFGVASAGAEEERFLLRGVPWKVYTALRSALDDEGSRLRLTYCKGDLELMNPSPQHEEAKFLFGRLFEAWCDIHDVDVFGQGSTTLRKKKKKRGLEADESYSIRSYKRTPDLALEVVYASWRLDKLEVYKGLGVAEVWIYRGGSVEINRLGARGYEVVARSELLPAIDLAHLASYIRLGESLTKVVRAYRASLK